VDTGSEDGTVAVMEDLARRHPWIGVLSEPMGALRRGAPSVRAFHAGFAALDDPPPVVANLDADVSVRPEFFARLLDRFGEDDALGIAGGTCYEREDGRWQQRHVTADTVWGACRAYRLACLRQILPLEERLSWDSLCQLKANALGWGTETFLDLPFFHHRLEGSRDGASRRARIAQGQAAHYMGYRLWYLTLRAAHHARRDPAAAYLLWGWAGAAVRRAPRCEDTLIVERLRRNQRLRDIPLRLREARGRAS
jgi:hypothetical protein